MIGLTVPQVQAAKTYRKTLIKSGLRLDRVDTLMDRYIKKKIRERAKTIARTETITALNRGQQESWKQAQKQGFVSKEAEKEWITTPMDACPICDDLDGQTVPVKDTFDSLKGPLIGPTAHPSCRCAVGLREP
jgi:hypothetical protein